MDETKTYILQCEKAFKIQDLCGWAKGDFIYCNRPKMKEVKCFNWSFYFEHHKCFNSVQIEEYKSWCIWLPRQDQLQGMVDSHSSWYLCNQFYRFVIDIIEYKKDISMEQLWLAFVMSEKYQKTWDGKEWIGK